MIENDWDIKQKYFHSIFFLFCCCCLFPHVYTVPDLVLFPMKNEKAKHPIEWVFPESKILIGFVAKAKNGFSCPLQSKFLLFFGASLKARKLIIPWRHFNRVLEWDREKKKKTENKTKRPWNENFSLQSNHVQMMFIEYIESEQWFNNKTKNDGEERLNFEPNKRSESNQPWKLSKRSHK